MRRITTLTLAILLGGLGCASRTVHTHVEQDPWQPDAVRALAAGGASLDAPDAEGRTPLWLAIRKGDVQRVKLLLELGADPNRVPEAQRADPPLVYAANSERAELVKLLLEHGARPELRRPSDIAPEPNALETAVKREELDIAVLVGLPAAARTHAADYEALMRAAFEKKPAEVKRRAAALDLRFEGFPAPSLLTLLYAWPQDAPRPAAPAAALFEAGYRPTPGDVEWLGAHLGQVIAAGDAATFHALMDVGPVWTDDREMPPSLVPVIVRTWVDDKSVRADAAWETMLIRALEAGAAPDTATVHGNTALHLACIHRDVTPAATEALLRAGASPAVKNDQGDLPIHAALEDAYGDVVDPSVALCVAAHWAAGLDIDVPNRNGDTPLMLAADKRRGEMVKVLLSYGADPARTNAKGETAYFLTLASPLPRDDTLAQDTLAAVSTLSDAEKARLDARLKAREASTRAQRYADAHRVEIEAAMKRLAEAERLEQEAARARAAAEAAAKARADKAAADQAERERRFRAPVEAPPDSFRRSYRENLSPAGGCPGGGGCAGVCCPPGCTCCAAAGYQRCLCPRGGLLIRGCPSGSKSIGF